jgi:hypothetical protein
MYKQNSGAELNEGLGNTAGRKRRGGAGTASNRLPNPTYEAQSVSHGPAFHTIRGHPGNRPGVSRGARLASGAGINQNEVSLRECFSTWIGWASAQARLAGRFPRGVPLSRGITPRLILPRKSVCWASPRAQSGGMRRTPDASRQRAGTPKRRSLWSAPYSGALDERPVGRLPHWPPD